MTVKPELTDLRDLTFSRWQSTMTEAEAAGWRTVEHVINDHGRVQSETGFWIDRARKERWLLRRHIHMLVGEKKA